MGRGDKRTKKGKIAMGSFGVSRPARPKKTEKQADQKAEKKTDEKAEEKA